MSFAVMPISDYVGACNVIREKTGNFDAVKSGELADKIKAVFEVGKASSGFDDGFNEGQNTEHMAFWDTFTNNGKITDYTNAFYNPDGIIRWNKDTFKPPYKLTVKKCSQMFHYFAWQCRPFIGITPDIVDFSQCTEAYKTFRNAHISPLVVDFSSLTKMAHTFSCDNGGNLLDTTVKVTEKLTSTDNPFLHNKHGATFTDDSVIACSISFSYCTLMTVKQAKSIINALKDFSGTDKEYACTVKLPSALWEALDNESTAPNGGSWKDYVYNTKCWNY
jgi:hypothetical protein